MEPFNRDFQWNWSADDIKSIPAIYCLLPALIYINKLEHPGDICSARNVLMNQRALDFIGNTQEEVICMGFDLFQAIVLPSDLENIRAGIKANGSFGMNTISSQLIHLRPKGKEKYRLFYCAKIVIDTFVDGSIKHVLVVALEIDESVDELALALNEIIRLKSTLIASLTNREKEVLRLIVKGVRTCNIADLLFVSVATVKTHRANIFRKTGTHNVIGLVLMVKESGEV